MSCSPESKHNCRFKQKHSATRNKIRNRRGAIAVLMAFVLPVLLMLSAYAVNSANVELYQTEMYCAADAAARAGSREYVSTRDKQRANSIAKQFALANTVAGEPLQLADQDIIHGNSVRNGLSSRYEFTPDTPRTNAVKVIADRSAGSLSGPLPVFMSSLLGTSAVEFRKSSIATQVEIDVCLVIDRSGSMAYAANEPAIYPPVPASAPTGWDFGQPAPPLSRWRNLVSAVSVFVNELEQLELNAQVAVASYNDVSATDQSLTQDMGSVLQSLQPYTNSFQLGGTNIGDGIREGLSAVTMGASVRPEAIKVLIVMTDGLHNVGTDPEDAASEAADENVLIYTITFSEEADQDTMSEVASRGGGKHYHATNLGDLSAAYTDIARKLPTLLTQ